MQVATDQDLGIGPTREGLLHALYEAAELEHNLMCTYLYAAFSLRDDDGLSAEEKAACARWRDVILHVAIDEMGHLTAVWNITAALGGQPHFGRTNFPLDPGMLPAGITVKLAAFNEQVLQHFIYLERPAGSTEPDGEGFAAPWAYAREVTNWRITPMPVDYDTVGVFYERLSVCLREFVERHGEAVAFAGDPALQLSPGEIQLRGANPVLCSNTALNAFAAIVEEGEGARLHSPNSHYARFVQVREELRALKAKNPDFEPAHPAATNPVLRRPLVQHGRVWIENEEAARLVDLANTSYGAMLRLIAYAYSIRRPHAEKSLAVDLAMGLMRAMTKLAERAARLPAGPSYPGCNAGMSFVALRDAAAFTPGPGARAFFVERLSEMATVAQQLALDGDERTVAAARMFEALRVRGERGFARAALELPVVVPVSAPAAASAVSADGAPPVPRREGAVDYIEAEKMTLIYEGKRCIHARFCVTGAPQVFLANVPGPWIHPDKMDVDGLVEIAHFCPSGAIRYKRKDGKPDESAPPVNVLSIREAGPYGVRGELEIDGVAGEYRATLCRCGASKNKPYCDGSHHDVQFGASGEPATGTQTDMLAVRNGPLQIDPQLDGPLQVRGNLEITAGTGRMVARVTSARLCRCGGSNTKPFCDGTHAKIGFRST
ncbi:MAG TPA: ferritin-like domain-containing protein [Polyangiales bacterium]|nr:ferritin-like domain-containing protein [Polyangiales bacterium]